MRCPRCMATYESRMRFCPQCGYCIEGLAVEESEPEEADALEAEPEETGSGTRGVDTVEVVSETTDEVRGDVAEEAPREDSDVAQDGLEAETSSEHQEGAGDSEVVQDDAGREEQAMDEQQGDARGSGAGIVERLRSFALTHKRASIAFCVVVGLAASGAIVGLMIRAEAARQEQERIAAHEEALNTSKSIELRVLLTETTGGKLSPIPLRVKGMAKKGESVDEVKLVNEKGEGLELLPGTYQVSLEGFPATDDGTLYEGSTGTFGVSVRERTSGEELEDEPEPLVFVFSPVKPQDIREEDVEKLRSWMRAAHVENASRYVSAVSTRRQAEVDRIAKEQADREQAELRQVEERTSQLEEELRNRDAQSDQGIVETS